MTTIEQAYDLLIEAIKNRTVHADYKRVCDYATLFRTFMTGEGADDLLEQFVLREDTEMFAQRKKITQNILKPSSATAMKPLYKIPRVTPVMNVITYKNPDKEKEDELRRVVDTFYGGESLDVFMEKRFPTLNGYDPNSFFLILIPDFDETLEKPKPYITEVPADQAIHFEYFNNDLQYLMVRSDWYYSVLSGDNAVKGNRYQFYGENYAIEFTQTDAAAYMFLKQDAFTDTNALVGPNKGQPVKLYRFGSDRVFEVTEFDTKSGKVPAVRVGCVPDPLTDGRTMVGILDNAEPYFMKTIKTVSELDIAMSLHAFPQKIEYTPSCPGVDNKGCKNGFDNSGRVCDACHGSGVSTTHTTGQETIRIKLPDERNIDKMFDLSKLVHYVQVPIDGMTFQKAYVDYLSERIMKSIYNSDIFVKDTVAETATNQRIQMESVYDTLQPFASHYAVTRTYVVTVMAGYLDLANDLIVRYSFPKDFKFKPVTTLLVELKAANDSQAPPFVKNEITNDIRSSMFEDRPEELKKLKIRDHFHPFAGKTEAEIQSAINGKRVTREAAVLYDNFIPIFVSLEEDAAMETPPKNFYDFPIKDQKEKIAVKVQAIIELIDAAEVVSIEFPKTEDLNPEKDTEIETEPDDVGKLPLALQQLSLTVTRLREAGENTLADQVANTVEQLNDRLLQSAA